MIHYEIIIAGFGGQGVLSVGMLLAHAAMLDGFEVTWLPSYGPEIRGGTANCHIVISEEAIGSPLLEKASVLIAMNRPSLDKYENIVIPGGIIITDCVLAGRDIMRNDVRKIELPASAMAIEMGTQVLANVVLLGALNGITNLISCESFEKALKIMLPEKKQHMIPLEIQAFNAGMETGRNKSKNATVNIS
jgi:2-oxoglutarate ferredoxin oxidoreductase subunit gamma